MYATTPKAQEGVPGITATSVVDLGALYSFAALTARVFAGLPEHGQKVLRRRFAGALKDNAGLSPLAFEMRTVAHLMARGFHVEFHDLCEGGGYDFFATDGEIAFEVECKSVSGDLGHRVHLQRRYQLIRFGLHKMQRSEKSGISDYWLSQFPIDFMGSAIFEFSRGNDGSRA
jgi:hypothetical protein